MKFIRSKNIYSKKVKGLYLILDPDKKHLRELNSLASFLWNLLKTPKTVNSLVNHVIKTYNTDPLTAEADITQWLKTCLKQKLVTKVS